MSRSSKVPEVCQVTVFLQGMPWVIGSCAAFRGHQLEVLEQQHGALICICETLPFFPIHGTVLAACFHAAWNRVQHLLVLHLDLLAFVLALLVTTKETARCLHPAAVACLGGKAACRVPHRIPFDHSESVFRQFCFMRRVCSVVLIPIHQNNLVEDCQGLTSSLQTHSYLPHCCYERFLHH